MADEILDKQLFLATLYAAMIETQPLNDDLFRAFMILAKKLEGVDKQLILRDASN